MEDRLSKLEEELSKVLENDSEKKSVEYYSQILDILEEQKEYDPLKLKKYIEYADDYSRVLRHIGRYKESEDLLLKILQLLKRYKAVDDRNEGVIYNNLGNLYRRIGNLEKAMEMYQKVEYSYSLSKGTEPSAWAALWNNKGMVLLKQDLYEEAYNYFSISRLVLIESNLKDSLLYATVVNNIIEPCARMNRKAEMNKCIDEVGLLINKLRSKYRKPLIAAVLNNKAVELLKDGEAKEASVYIDKSYDIVKEIYGVDSAFYQIVGENLTKIEDIVDLLTA